MWGGTGSGDWSCPGGGWCGLDGCGWPPCGLRGPVRAGGGGLARSNTHGGGLAGGDPDGCWVDTLGGADVDNRGRWTGAYLEDVLGRLEAGTGPRTQPGSHCGVDVRNLVNVQGVTPTSCQQGGLKGANRPPGVRGAAESMGRAGEEFSGGVCGCGPGSCHGGRGGISGPFLRSCPEPCAPPHHVFLPPPSQRGQILSPGNSLGVLPASEG